MTDPDDRDEAQLPEAGPDDEPAFDEPSGPAPAVVDAPGRSSEF